MIHTASYSNKVFGSPSPKPHYAVLHQHKSASCVTGGHFNVSNEKHFWHFGNTQARIDEIGVLIC